MKHPSTKAGFTLLEMLVAMSLLATLMALLMAALRTMGQAETRVDQQLERMDELRTARQFLGQTLARVSVFQQDEHGATGKKTLPFQATPTSIAWLGIMPARAGAGGRSYFRLAIEEMDAGPALVLRFQPWQASHVNPDWSRAEPHVLVKRVQQFSVQAQGLPSFSGGLASSRSQPLAWPLGWQSGWPVSDALPDQVRLSLIDENGPLTDMTFQLMALPQGDSSTSLVVVGGAR